jgi:hypothetical protein
MGEYAGGNPFPLNTGKDAPFQTFAASSTIL